MLLIRKRLNQQVCKRPSVFFEGVESPLRGTRAGTSTSSSSRRTRKASTTTSTDANTAASTTSSRYRASCSPRRPQDHRLYRLRGDQRARRQAHERHEVQRPRLRDGAVGRCRRGGKRGVPRRRSRAAARRRGRDGVRRPDAFDVVVASNPFGDFFTDLGAIISGNMGLAPSANLCVDGDAPSMFEPVHGSAAGIIGRESRIRWRPCSRVRCCLRTSASRLLRVGYAIPSGRNWQTRTHHEHPILAETAERRR